MFKVKAMSKEDIEFAVQITDTMDWNLTEKDFELMMSLEPEGCFILLHNSERIGVATTVSFGKVGWIGNVIVDEKYRRKGAGGTLLRHAMAFLKSRGVETIGLYSYKEKVDFYTQLGFRSESEFTVLRGEAFSSIGEEVKVPSLGDGTIQKIIDFDGFYFGASREKLLKKIVNTKENLCYYYSEHEGVSGYIMAKVYGRYVELGPLVCRRGRGDVAVALLKAVLNRLKDFEVSLCLPKREKNIVEMLLNAGFREEFPVVRMFSGPPAFKDCIYIAESLERG
ncbi:MAG: GNAT family N-acetyltransferase [Nitrososphaerota archaeon]|nr:GNAT family N-acetyltransferase [Candidatus Bathyarchaeota archaeon]MDW8022654.1 GNAT family N-acetyltransferase [Nitrososphaerota archaeon]